MNGHSFSAQSKVLKVRDKSNFGNRTILLPTKANFIKGEDDNGESYL